MSIQELFDLENIDEPAKRWRNRYLPLRDYVTVDGDICKRGNECWGRLIWPSKDAAETDALTHPNSSVVRGFAKYLGAFPVTE